MLRAQNLEITFNPGTPIENRALRGLDMHIPKGQFVTVIGSNGAGKSTFLNAVSGDLIVDRGSIHIDGQDVTKKSAWQRADLVARVFQDPMAGTCESLTIEENMALAWKRGESRRLRLLAQPQPARGIPRQAAHPQPRAGEPALPIAWACSRAASARR